jgi:hypothetical protein
MDPAMAVVLCTVASVMACTTMMDNRMMVVMGFMLQQLMTCDAAVCIAMLAAVQQPSMLRLFSLPRRPRRLWSDRVNPDTKKEESNGAWEHHIMGKSAKLREQGLVSRVYKPR